MKWKKTENLVNSLTIFCTTTGTGTATGSAAKFGDAIGKRLVEDHVDGVILVST